MNEVSYSHGSKLLLAFITIAGFLVFNFGINDVLAQAPQQEMTKPTPPQETSCELHSPDIDEWADVNQWDDLILKAIDEVAEVPEVAGTRVPGDRIKAHMMIESGGDPEAFQDKPGESSDAYGLMQYTGNAASFPLLTEKQVVDLHKRNPAIPYASIYAGTLELAYRYVTNNCNMGWDGASYGYFGGDPCGHGAIDTDTGTDPATYHNTLQRNLNELEKSQCSEALPAQPKNILAPPTPGPTRTSNPTQTPIPITPTPFVCLGSCLADATPTPSPCGNEGASPSPSQPSQPPGDIASQLQDYFARLRQALNDFFTEFRNNMQEFSNSLQNRPPGSPVVPPEIPELNLPTFEGVQLPGGQSAPPPASPAPCASEEAPEESESTPEPTTNNAEKEEKPIQDKTDKPLPKPTDHVEQNPPRSSATPTSIPTAGGKPGQPLPSQNAQEIKQRLCNEYRVCPTISKKSQPGGDWTLDALTALWNVTQRMYESATYVNHAIGHGTLEVARAETSPNDWGWAFGVYLDRDYPTYSTIPGSRLINITDRAFANNPSVGYWEWLLAHEIAHSAGEGKPDGNQINNPPSNQTHQNVILCPDVVSSYGAPSPNKQKLVSDDENYADSVSFYMTSGEEIVSGYYGGAKNLKTDHPCIYKAIKEGYFEGKEF